MKPKRHQWLLNRRTLSNLFVVCAGITFYLTLANLGPVRKNLAALGRILSPFVAGFMMAYLLNIPMHFFEEKVFYKYKMRRGLAVFTTYVATILVLTVLVGAVIPQVGQSVVDLVNNLEVYMRNLNGLVEWGIEYFNLPEEEVEQLVLPYMDILSTVIKAMPQLLDFGVALGNGVVTALTAVISSIYMLNSKHVLISQTKRLMYAVLPTRRADKVLRVSRKANEVFAGFIGGKLIDSAIMGVLCFVGMSIFRMPYAALISLIVGVTNVIPFFGPFVGAIPSALILLIVDPWKALYFLIFVLVLQQFDGNVLGPKILGDSTGLSAIWVLVAIIVGGGLFGFAGMLLGVPTFAVLYSMTREWVHMRLEERGLTDDCAPLPEVREETDEPAGGERLYSE